MELKPKLGFAREEGMPRGAACLPPPEAESDLREGLPKGAPTLDDRGLRGRDELEGAWEAVGGLGFSLFRLFIPNNRFMGGGEEVPQIKLFL